MEVAILLVSSEGEMPRTHIYAAITLLALTSMNLIFHLQI